MSDAAERPNLEHRLTTLEREFALQCEHCFEMRSSQREHSGEMWQVNFEIHKLHSNALRNISITWLCTILVVLLAFVQSCGALYSIKDHRKNHPQHHEINERIGSEHKNATAAMPRASVALVSASLPASTIFRKSLTAAFCPLRLFCQNSLSSCFSFACRSAIVFTEPSEYAGTCPRSISRDLRLSASSRSSWSMRYWAGDCANACMFSQDSAISTGNDAIRSSSLIRSSIARYGATNFSISARRFTYFIASFARLAIFNLSHLGVGVAFVESLYSTPFGRGVSTLTKGGAL